MRKIYNRKKNREIDSKDIPINEEPFIEEVTLSNKQDSNTIEEFMEIKKLQNKVLGKILENMNQSENQEIINNN